MSGLGTSSQNVTGQNATVSQTNPWPAAIPGLEGLVGNATGNFMAMGQGNNNAFENSMYKQADQNLAQMPNFGPAAAQTAANYLQTGGDPTGLLRSESNSIGIGDPQNAPGMQNVLNTIQNDVSNQINGQFAGAGRSLSGLNEQTLARGLSQGEAVPLLNQYNQDIANQLGIQSAASGNIQTGLQDASQGPQLAQQVPMARNALNVQYRDQPASIIGAYENLINPIAGLGGTSQGNNTYQMNGQATNSILGQLGQVGGLLGPFGNLLGTIL